MQDELERADATAVTVAAISSAGVVAAALLCCTGYVLVRCSTRSASTRTRTKPSRMQEVRVGLRDNGPLQTSTDGLALSSFAPQLVQEDMDKGSRI